LKNFNYYAGMIRTIIIISHQTLLLLFVGGFSYFILLNCSQLGIPYTREEQWWKSFWPLSPPPQIDVSTMVGCLM